MTEPAMAGRDGEAAWRTDVARVTGGRTPEDLTVRTRDGLPLGPLYPMAQRPAAQPTRDAARAVGIVQRVDHPDPARSADIAAAEIAGGATGLDLILAGSASARGFGLEWPSPGDLHAALGPVDLDTTALRFAFPATGSEAALDALLGPGRPRGFVPDHPNLDVAADPLSAAVAATGQGRRFDPQAIAAAAAWWSARLVQLGVPAAFLRVDGRLHHEAGASEAQELAAVLSAGVFYLRVLERGGLLRGSDAVRFTLAADPHTVLLPAKLRAFRRLWGRVRAACGLDPEPVRLHVETGWRVLARVDPWTNQIRNAVACAGALVGGADSVTVLPYSSALGLPDAFARRVARNAALVLIEEARLACIADPCAGAGAFETMTEALCTEAWRLFQGLERQGGIVTALASGSWQAEVAAVAEQRRAACATGSVIVGVTAFRPADDVPAPVLIPAASPSRVSIFPATREAEAFEIEAEPRPVDGGCP